MTSRRSASEARAAHIAQQRPAWLNSLPRDFRKHKAWAGYDFDKKPVDLKRLLLWGKDYPIGNDAADNLVSFEDARRALESHPDKLLGLAFSVAWHFRIGCFDLDCPLKKYAELVADPKCKIPPDELARRRDRQIDVNRYIVSVFKAAGALIMLSQSGNGLHIFFRYAPPDGKSLPNGKLKFCGQLIAHSGFVYITGQQAIGRSFGTADDLPDCSEALAEAVNKLVADGDFAKSRSAQGTLENGERFEVLPSEEFGRRLDLSDWEVVEKSKIRDKSGDAYAILTEGKLIPTPKGTPSPSMAIYHAISILDRISGDPEQIARIVMNSAVVRNSADPAGSNESRAAKSARIIPNVLRDKRQKNDAHFAKKAADQAALADAVDLSAWDARPQPGQEAHGSPQAADPFAGMDELERAAKEAELAALAADGLALPLPDAPALDDDEAGADASRQLQGGPRLRAIRAKLQACCLLAAPESSPWMSRLIDANCEAMKLPFRKFALLATISFMGGLMGRKYKTKCGLSAAQSFILVAPSGTGKGLALGYWPKKFIKARNLRRMRKAHVLNGKVSSQESLHGDVQHTGTTIHYRPDAGSDLKSIAQPKSDTAEALRDRIYEFFDSSNHGEPDMHPPSSLSAKRRGDRPIKAAQFCSIWSTTPAIFTSVYSSEFLASGGGQRLLISVHDAHGGDPIPDDEIETLLPDDIRDWLSKLLDDVNDLDTAYFKASKAEYPTEDNVAPDYDEAEKEAKLAAALTMIVPYDDAAAAANWRLDQAVAAVMKEVNSKRLPPHYAMFGRLVMAVKRLALISAVLRDRYRPLIGEVDIAWGLAFALDCFVSLAASFDRGDSGDATDGARESAILGWFESSTRSKETKHGKRIIQDGWVPFNWLKQRAQMNNAFKDRNKGSDEMLLKALEMMVKGEQIEKSSDAKGALKFKLIGE